MTFSPADTTPPTIVFTSPSANDTIVSSAILPVSGTASDNVGVTGVSVRVNGGSWSAASGTTAWSKSLTLSSGSNTIEAYASDAAGNTSAIASRTVTYQPAVPKIAVRGNGINIPNNDDQAYGTGTYFGVADVTGSTVTHTFTIENTGSAALSLTGSPRVAVSGPNAPEFTVTVQPAPLIGSGAPGTLFTVVFDPASTGSREATLSIASNDAVLSTFTIYVTGTGISSAPGGLDTAFDPNVEGTVYSIAVHPLFVMDIGGGFSSVQGSPQSRLSRISYAGNNVTGHDFNVGGAVRSLLVQADDQTVFGGSFVTADGFLRNYLARLDSWPSSDPNFNPNAEYEIYAGAIQPNRMLLVGGAFTDIGLVPRNHIARLNAAGGVDSTFNPGANGSVYSIAMQGDGKILAGGTFTTAGGGARNHLVRFTAAGALDTAFDPNVTGTVYCIAVQANQNILIGGSFSAVRGVARTNIARITPAGTVDAAFNPGADGSIYSIALQTDGAIIAGGGFQTIGGVPRNHIARLNMNGVPESTFDPGADATVYAVALEPEGKILIGGSLTSVSGVPRNGLARLINSPATETLSLSSLSRVQWLRGGTAPETQDVAFEFSSDDATWTSLGAGVRMTGGWEKSGLNLPSRGIVRARARTTSGRNNASSGVVEAGIQYSAAPEIAVEQPSGTNLRSGRATIDFGTVSTGGTGSALTFTIRNSGLAPLGGIVPSFSGGQSGDFAVTAPPGSVLPPGNSFGLFTVSFHPLATGTRTTTLLIASNDSDENPFSITLTGSGVDTTPPLLAITVPVAGGPVTNSPALTISGTATDNTGVTAVMVRLNGSSGGLWQAVAGTASWSRPVNLRPGLNEIEAQAADGAGNLSGIVTRTVYLETMDGIPDSAGYLLLNAPGGIKLYAALRGNRLYVATESPGSNSAGTYDTHILVTNTLQAAAATNKYWAKAGLMAASAAMPLLGGESSNDFAGWVNAGATATVRKSAALTGVLEGTLDLTEAFGTIPSVLYFSAAAHNTADGGTMLRQAPPGNGDQNLDPAEFLAVPLEALVDRTSDGILDRLDPAIAFRASVTRTTTGVLQISWPVVPGLRYQPQWSAGLNTWQSFGSVITAGSGEILRTVSDTQAAGLKGFYRVRQVP